MDCSLIPGPPQMIGGQLRVQCLGYWIKAYDVPEHMLFTKLVEIEALGVKIEPDNALMCECGGYLQEALSLGKLVLHRSGEEGIDELWGEPLKARACRCPRARAN